MIINYLTLLGAALFYLIYLVKGWLLRKQGITVNLLGDKRRSREKYFEIVLRALTGFGGAIQFVAPFLFERNSTSWGYLGVFLVYLGVLLFLIAVKAMGLNWRAGFNEEQKTNLVTTGIYQLSRNPAFVAFDLLYIGFAFVFPNFLMILTALIAILLFDLQIHGEEKFLLKTFGERYRQYQTKVRRYF